MVRSGMETDRPAQRTAKLLLGVSFDRNQCAGNDVAAKVVERVVSGTVLASQRMKERTSARQAREEFIFQSWGIVTALPGEQLMPLSRLNDGFEIDLEGIAFSMADRRGHTWRCLITDRALTDAMGGDPTRKQKAEWFRAKRSSVERAASDRFDMGAFEKDGFIRIAHWKRNA
jgi:hypothetical protein